MSQKVPSIRSHNEVLCIDVRTWAKHILNSASFSLGGQDGSMVIDLQAFNSISVGQSGVAQVGSGVRLGNMALGLYDQGKRALPHGVCPGVGVGGHASHGGYCELAQSHLRRTELTVAYDRV